MNKTNILVPFCIEGTDESSLNEAVEWVKQHTFHKVVNTMNVKLLSLQSYRKKEGQCEVKFFYIDPYEPYIMKKENLFEFNMKKIKLNERLFSMLQDTGLMLEIEEQFYILNEDAIKALGGVLNFSGKKLKESFLGRDLCLAEAFTDIDELRFVYRQNNNKGLKMMISAFGNKFVYKELDTAIEHCLYLLMNSQDLEMHKWSVINNGADIFMDYPQKMIALNNGAEWNCGIHIKIKTFAGPSTQVFWYVRNKENYVIVRTENIKHSNNSLDAKRKKFHAGYFQPYHQFRSALKKLNCGEVDLQRAMTAYELRGSSLLNAVEETSGVFKTIGYRDATVVKDKLENKLKGLDLISMYDLFMMIFEYSTKYSQDLNERYWKEYCQSIAVLAYALPKVLSKYCLEQKIEQIAGQMSFDDFVVLDE